MKLKKYAFCPTGEGGGIDNSCPPEGGLSRNGRLVYKATPTKVIDSIISTGLKKNGGGMWRNRPYSVYFTESKAEAHYYGQFFGDLDQNHGDSKYAIVEFAIPEDVFKSSAIVDEVDREFNKNSWRIEKDIPPGWIRGVSVYHQDMYKKITLIDQKKIGQHGAERIGYTVVFIDDAEKKDYAAGFDPVDALNYLQGKAVVVKGIIDDELTKRVRLILLNYLKGGDLLRDVQHDIAAVFEPYTGNPMKIVPSGVSGTPEDVMQAYRLENIIRTETTDALMQGRLAVGDAAEDYIVGYEFSAILDDRTTEVCDFADGLIIRANDPRLPLLTPPVFFQCRSTLIFITTDDLPVNWSTDAEIDRAVALIPRGFNKYEHMMAGRYGGDGSGHWGHAGRPGEVGGSSPGGGQIDEDTGGSDNAPSEQELMTVKHPMPGTAEARAEADAYIKKVSQHPAFQKAEEFLKHGTDTAELYRKGGIWDLRRAQLQEKIIGEGLNPAAAVGPDEKPTAILLMGMGGSGKTSVLKAQIPNLEKYTIIDADGVRGKLPEYNGYNSGLTQEEASYIAEGQILPRAAAARHNIVFDATGKTTQKYTEIAKHLKALGYNVDAMYVQINPITAMERATQRFLNPPAGEPGRYFRLTYLYDEIDGKPGRTYEALKASGLLRRAIKIDNNRDFNPFKLEDITYGG